MFVQPYDCVVFCWRSLEYIGCTGTTSMVNQGLTIRMQPDTQPDEPGGPTPPFAFSVAWNQVQAERRIRASAMAPY